MQVDDQHIGSSSTEKPLALPPDHSGIPNGISMKVEETEGSASLLLSFPDAVRCHLFTFLSPRELNLLRATCKDLRTQVDDTTIIYIKRTLLMANKDHWSADDFTLAIKKVREPYFNSDVVNQFRLPPDHIKILTAYLLQPSKNQQ